MENTMKMYITADEVGELLGVSRGYAYKDVYKRQDLHLERNGPYDKYGRRIADNTKRKRMESFV